jgi:hypothetical protein
MKDPTKLRITTDTSGWVIMQQPVCDLCNRRAIWRHPDGGLRCSTCPRP